MWFPFHAFKNLLCVCISECFERACNSRFVLLVHIIIVKSFITEIITLYKTPTPVRHVDFLSSLQRPSDNTSIMSRHDNGFKHIFKMHIVIKLNILRYEMVS